MATVCVNSNEFEVDDQGRLNIKKGCGLVSDDTGLHPATSPWPFTCDEEDNGTLISCSPVDGLLRGAPRGKIISDFVSKSDGDLANIPMAPTTVMTNNFTLTNTSCYPAWGLQVIQAQAVLLVDAGVRVRMDIGGLTTNQANEVGDWEPQGGSSQHRIGGEFTVIRLIGPVAPGANANANSSIVLEKMNAGNADRTFLQINHRLMLFSL